MISYKAELVGIDIIKVREFITVGGKRKGSSQTCCYCGKKGMRVYRGLFKCTSCGLEINADVNGAINHAKWGKESSFDHFSKELLNKILPIPFSMPTAPA